MPEECKGYTVTCSKGGGAHIAFRDPVAIGPDVRAAMKRVAADRGMFVTFPHVRNGRPIIKFGPRATASEPPKTSVTERATSVIEEFLPRMVKIGKKDSPVTAEVASPTDT